MNYRESDLILRLDNKIPSYDVSLNGQTKFYTLCNILLDSAAVHAIDILHHIKEMDSIGFYEATGSTSLRVPAGSCCRPLMRFA